MGLLSPAGQPADAAASPAITPEQQAQGIMLQIRELHMAMDALARQNPLMAEDMEIAKQALTNAMTKTVIAMSSTEPQSAPQLI
jgi:hypothetical protein